MHNNYFFLRQLTAELGPLLKGAHLLTCFSQQKDELILGFGTQEKDWYLKAHLTGTFAAISLAEQFERARRNSVDLFEEVIGQKVQAVVQHQNERSFHLSLSRGYQLVFKLFGNRSNVLLIKEDRPLRIFNHQLKNDWKLTLSQLNRELDFSKEHFLQSEQPVRKLYPTLGDLPLLYLEEHGFSDQPKERQWEMLEQLFLLLNRPFTYRVVRFKQQIRLSLVPVGETMAEFSSALEAQNHFVRLYLSEQGFQTLYQNWHQRLSKALQQSLQFIDKNNLQLKELETGKSYSQLADVLMANLHQIPSRSKNVELFNFYSDQPVTFQFKENESPQKLAERYYKKAKQQPHQIARLQEAISAKEMDALQLKDALDTLEQITEFRELKKFTQTLESKIAAVAKTEAGVPFKTYRFLNFDIWVGRSAKNNDQLTQKYAHKDDLWLHAKDVPGSHVIIRQQAGKPFPQLLIEKAAQLAAWHSKRKTDSLCPVSFTPKKYVRKRKGAAAGEVVVEREKVVLVVPAELPELLVA